MTGPETHRAHQISRSELLICIYRNVLRPGRPGPQEGVPSGSGSKNSYILCRVMYSCIYEFNLWNYMCTQPCRHDLTGFCEKVSWRNAAELQSEATVPYIVRTSVARRIQLGAVRLLQTKIAEGSLRTSQNYGNPITLGVRGLPVLQFSSAEHKVWCVRCVSARPNLRYIRIPRRLSQAVQIRSSSI